MEQRSPEWFAARLGKVTASRVADVVARTKSGWGASRGNYLAELIAERLTGSAAERFTNAAMQWGTDCEPAARNAYAATSGMEVVEVGMIVHPTISMAAASPDGLVGDLGLVEVKCPNTLTHIDTLIGGTVPGKYVTQMQWQMACTEREWCDFVSFDPRLPAEMQLFVRRVERDDALIASLEADVRDFLAEVDAKIEALKSAVQQKEAA
jgi:putative phage-type endonuclease